MAKALLFALVAAIGNALFVYGQRGTRPSANPFIFMLGAVIVCTLLFGIVTGLSRGSLEPNYVAANYRFIVISGVGFFVTFLGFYLLYSRFGASYYVVYAVLSIIATSIGVGVLIYKEPFNVYHGLSILLAIAAVAVYGYASTRC